MKQDLCAQFHDQVEFLRASSRAYDAGNEAEAKRLATTLRVMLHDTPRSTSLLTHLALKERLPYCDTGPPEEPPGAVVAIDCGLCMLNLNLSPPASVSYKPVLDSLSEDRRHPPTCFQDWWTTAVLRDTEGNEFSRRSFVLNVADKDGGAHIDATLGAEYAALTRGNSLGLGQSSEEDGHSVALTMNFEGLRRVAATGDASPPSNSIALASVRQIAHEVCCSLDLYVEDTDGRLVLREQVCPIPVSAAPDLPRNDPCPCESGRKFKKCFGQRQPRRAAKLPR